MSYYLVRMFNWYPYVIAWWQQILTITFMCGRACESICIDHIFVCVWLLKFSRWGANSIYSVYEINVKSLALNPVVWPDTDISLVSVCEDLLLETFYLWVVVVILFPEEYSTTHSICKTFLKSFHKWIPLAVAREPEAHRADNRYLTIIQLEGSRVIGGYFMVPRCVEHIIFSKWVIWYQWIWYLLIVIWYNKEQISMISWQSQNMHIKCYKM